MFADDVVAAALDSAVAVLLKGRRIHHFHAWFYKTVRNIASKRVAEAQVLRDSGRDVASVLYPDPSENSTADDSDARRRALVARAIDHASWSRVLPTRSSITVGSPACTSFTSSKSTRGAPSRSSRIPRSIPRLIWIQSFFSSASRWQFTADANVFG